MAKDILEIGDSSFESEVLQSDKPVLVDFWAPWCGPCRAIAPIVEELAKDFGDKVKFAKCNVDENPTTPTKYGIKSIPTLIFFKDGEIQDKVIGIVAKSRLEEMISKVQQKTLPMKNADDELVIIGGNLSGIAAGYYAAHPGLKIFQLEKK